MAKLQIDIEVDDKGTPKIVQFARATEAAGKQVGEGAKVGSKGLHEMGTSADQTATKLTALLQPANLLKVALGAAIVAELKTSLTAATQFADELYQLQLLTGSSTRQLASLVDVANDVGVEFGQVQLVLLNLATQSDDADSVLSQLNLTAKDGVGRFLQFAQAAAKIEDATQRASFVSEVFGTRIAAKLLPVIDRLKDGTASLEAETNQFANILGHDGVEALRNFGIAQGQVGDAMLQLHIVIAKDLLPTLNPLVFGLQKVLELFSMIPSPVRAAIEVLGLAAGAITAVNAALRLLGVAGLAMTGPVGWIALAVAGIAMLVGSIDDLTGKLSRAWEMFKQRGMVAPTPSQGLAAPSTATGGSAGLTIVPKDVLDANAAIKGQIESLQAQRIEMEQGTVAALKYSLAHGEMAKASPKLKADLIALTASLSAMKTERSGAAESIEHLAVGLTLGGTAAAEIDSNLTPLNVRLADANTLFQDVRVGTKEYSLALTDLTVSLSDATEQADGYSASTSEVAAMLNQTDPVLKSLEDRLAEQITLFPKTRVQADAYLSTLADITTTTQETAKATGSLKGVFADVFDGITEVLSLFGVKVGKVILMLQQLPRASGGIEKLAKGIGSVVGMIATPSSAVAALDWGGADGPISNIRQLGAASGDAAGDLGVFGGIVGVVSRLLGVFGQGLSAFGGKIGSLLTQMGVPGAAALGQAASGGIASFGIAQILGLGKGGQFASLGAGAIGSYFGGSGIGTVVGIAAGMVMESVQDFFKHPSFKNAIALGLNTVFPGIGTLAMKLFGGLFGPTPTGKLKAEIEPFNRSSLDDIVNQAGFGTAVGVARVNVGGNLMKSKKEQELQQQLADMLNELVQGVINTTVELIKMLPSQLGAQLDDALSALEATGLEIVDKKWKGGGAGKKLKKRIKGLADEAVQELFDALYGADLDLKALGGGERGDAAKGFDAVTAALGTMSAIIKETGISVDATAISLAEFTTKSVNYLQQFSRDGETFAETIQRVAEEFGQLFGVIDQLNVDISTSSQSGFEGLVDAYQQSVDRIQELADAGLVAIESGASPAEIAAAAQALRDAMDTSMQFLVAIQQRLQALNAAIVTGVDLYADIEVSIRALGGATMAVDELIDAAYRLAAATGNTGSQISIFESVLQVVGADFSTFTAALPRMAGAFSDLMAAIRSTVSNAEAITQLQSLAQAVGNGAQSAYQGIANGAARARDAAQSAADARIQALEDERRAIQDVAQEQEEANRAQLDALRQWQSIAQSAKAQLTDLFNLLAPTHPQTSFSEILAQFRSEVSGFGPGSTPGAATNIQELAQQVLQLAQGVPGMDLASGAFQSLAAEVKVALEAVQAVAANQPSEEELLGQIAQSGTDQSARLAGIDEAIRAEQDRLQSTLQSISAQEQQQIAYVNAQQVAALSEIRNHLGERLLALQAEQEAAREILQQITGELSFEQFIAQQQSKSVEMLGQIRDTLKTYLGNIIDGLGFDVPAMASGGIVTRPTLALIGERGPEAVVPLSQPYAGLASGQQVVTFAPGAVTVQVTGREHVGELTDKLDKAMVRLVKGPSQTHKALTDLAQRGGRR